MCAHSVCASVSRRNGGVPDEQLVQHARERILVGPPVHVAPADLLRGEVVERSREAPVAVVPPSTELLRQAEVAQVAMVGRVDEDVSGLDVAVDEPTLVRGVERVRDLADEPHRTLRSKRPVVEQRAEVGAVDESGCEVELPVRLARRVDGQDAGVVDGGGHPRLAEEPLSEGRRRRRARVR